MEEQQRINELMAKNPQELADHIDSLFDRLQGDLNPHDLMGQVREVESCLENILTQLGQRGTHERDEEDEVVVSTPIRNTVISQVSETLQ